MPEGNYGGNGSVVWSVSHQRSGTFRCVPGTGKPEPEVIQVGGNTDAYGRDPVSLEEINTGPIQGLAPEYQRSGHFTVRLRFDGNAADDLERWYYQAGKPPEGLRLQKTGAHQVILVVLVKAINRDWPTDDRSWGNLPWEVQTNW